MTRPPARAPEPTHAGAGTAQATASAAPAPSKARVRHVDELDVIRVLTFACVIGVHVVSHDNARASVSANAALILLHFTREAFFWLTGFVLTLQYGRRHLDLTRFYRRRFQLVGIPYVAWSLIYFALTLHTTPTARGHWGTLLLQDLAFGQAWYHLYFLLVSLQVYLLFPLIAALIRRTEGHHGVLLAVAGVVQFAVLAGLKWEAPYTGWASWMNAHESVLFWNYEFWVIAGAVAAWHIDAVRAWTATYRRPLAVAVVVAAGLTLAYYAAELSTGESPRAACAVLQPIMLFWSPAAVLGLFLIGRRYAAAPATSALRSAVKFASDRSFGIFLVHPLVIWTAGQFIDRWTTQHIANPWRTFTMYVVAVTGAVLVTEVLRRIPVSLILTGRPMLRRRRADTPAVPA